MGKKNKSSLGRSLIKDRFSNNHGRKMVDGSMLHTTEIQDGYNWGRLNLQSVTEESSFQEFLATAELAGTEFQAEKLNIKFFNPKNYIGLLNKEEKQKVKEKFQANKDSIKIPRRPPWSIGVTTEELHAKERDSFLEWRKSLAVLEEEKGILLTPYEKNIEFWRQLWRVLERSDVVVQIVDARNPLLFWCEDLNTYVKEISKDKLNLILLNKADYLTENQRHYWANYFSSIGIQVAFFSAILASDADTFNENHITNNQNLSDIKRKVEELELSVEKTADSLSKILNTVNKFIETKIPNSDKLDLTSLAIDNSLNQNTLCNYQNSSKILSRTELISYLKNIHKLQSVGNNVVTIGLVGYPNVGKSSTINALMTVKKVSVSATPGKTKHFQTLYLDDDLLLCDCPGLVMPSFVYTKGEMIINGILPVDQMRDHVPPINLISSLIPRHVIEDKYGIMFPKPLEGEDEDRCPTAEEILNAYGFNRGFMTANGQPDNPRSARFIIKDFISGQLLYVHPPPGINDEDFHDWPPKKSINKILPSREIKALKTYRITSEELDKNFFNYSGNGVHTKGEKTGASSTQYPQTNSEKPWKQFNKHANKKKKEKLRRVYAHLDEH